MAIIIEKNQQLILERNQLLRRLEELNSQIGDNLTNTYKKLNEGRKMAEETTSSDKPKLSMQERFDKCKALLAQGKKNSEIAKELNCSTAYVYNVKIGKVTSKVSKK